MTHNLYFRLLASFTLIIIIILGSAFFFAYRTTHREISELADSIQSNQDQRIQLELTRYYQAARTWDGIQPYIIQWGNLYGRRIILTDAENMVVADSDEALVGTAYTDTDIPITIFRFSGNLLIGNLSVADQGSTDINRASMQIVFNSIGKFFVWAALLASCIALLLTAFLSQRILAPIRALTRATRYFGRGDFSRRVQYDGRGEMGELARSFNSMAEDLEKNEIQRRHMVADIAHELRTPLSNLRGYLEAISDGLVKPDEDTIRSLSEEADSLSRLVNDIQELSLADAGALKMEIEAVSPAALITDTVKTLEPKAITRELSLTTDLPDTLPEIQADAHRIGEILKNLIENAIAHTDPGGRIIVAAAAREHALEISVSDTGEGIPAEDLPRIFERFYRVDKSRTRATGGTGLGLTIAKRLVEAHDGTISVSSVQGQGTTFTVTLPLHL